MYVTDALKLIAENTAKYAGGGYIQKRYVDVITTQKEEARTPEEVTSHMLKKLRGR